ncbi:MAG: hypothetical protein RLY43_1749 [Bacteroidota bacterium]
MIFPIEKQAFDILKTYNGTNDYILSLQRSNIKNKSFVPTKKQAEYIVRFSKTEPIVYNKLVTILRPCREFIRVQLELEEKPEKIFINKLLSRRGDLLHLWASIGEDDKNYKSIYISKDCIKQNKPKPIIDYEKYERKPLEHQKTAVESLLVNDKFILGDQMGLGKSVSSIIAALEGNFKKILVVCPASLKLNWKKEILFFDKEENVSIVNSFDFRTSKWTIINYDILKNFHKLPEKGEKLEDLPVSPIDFYKFDLVIADECFPYNTLVTTDIGEIKIGDIVENNLQIKVLSFNILTSKLEYKPINRWIKKESDNILKISLANELFIECTPNHKIYVKEKGYVRADEIIPGDKLYLLQKGTNTKTNLEERSILFKKMCNRSPQTKPCLVTKTKRKRYKNETPASRKIMRMVSTKFSNKEEIKKTFLWNILFCEMENVPTRNKTKNLQYRCSQKNKQCVYTKLPNEPRKGQKIVRAHAQKQPNVQSRECKKNAKFIKGKNFSFKGWKRKNNNTRTKDERLFRSWMGITLSDKNKKSSNIVQITTPVLSSGHWKCKFKNSNRNRWKNAPTQEMAFFGQEKNRSIEFVGVDSITILESGSRQSDRKLFKKDKRVYNIEVNDNHNYFADNILVSNCHYLKNSKSQRTKLFNDFVSRINTRWLLTGTPMTNRPIDLYNLLSICNSPIAENWVHYVRRYCAGKQIRRSGSKQKFWLTSGSSNLDELKEYLSDVMLRRLKTEVLDLPPKTVQPIYLPMEYLVTYNQYLEEYESWVEEMAELGQKPTMTDHLTKLIKLRQLLSNDKIKSTIEIIEDLIENDMKVVVFSCFTQTINTIHEHFGKQSVIIDGSVSSKKRDYAVTEFQTNPKIKVFCGNIVAAGVGLTLTEGNIVIFNDLDWVPSNHAQAEDRCHRIGQINDVHILYMLFDDTLDTIMYDVLKSKMMIINQVVGDKEEEQIISVGNAVIDKLVNRQ